MITAKLVWLVQVLLFLLFWLQSLEVERPNNKLLSSRAAGFSITESLALQEQIEYAQIQLAIWN